MNEQIKAKWLDALGSGEYEQCYGTLKSCIGRFCCLGVLTDVMVKEKNYTWDHNEYGDKIVRELGDESALLPTAVQEWSGMPDESGNLPDFVVDRNGTRYWALTGLNDCGFTFEQISDFIRAFI